MQPVGPLPPRTYWIRRGLVIGLPLLLILIIAVSCSGGGGKKKGSGNTPNPTITQTTAAAPQPCTKSEVSLKISGDKTGYTIGEQPAFSGVFTNDGSRACVLTISKAQEQWTVTSGDVTVWTTKGCETTPAQQKTKTKTLAPGLFKTVSITWTGQLYSKCAVSSSPTLSSGQYILHATLDGFTPSKVFPFQMTAPAGG